VHSDGGGVGTTAFSAIYLFSKKNKFNYFETRKRLAFKYQLNALFILLGAFFKSA
jgi:hypothetical protein